MNKRNKKIELKNKNGITLIALVLTIIVLLILTGVSIVMLSGENGILSQPENVKEKTQEAEEKIENPSKNTVMALGVNPIENTSGSGFANINIYGLRIYDKALTQEEIQTNYEVNRKRYNF